MTRHQFKLKENDIKEFQDLYRDTIGTSLTYKEAEEYAICFLEFMYLMLG